jgi:hypothetical protein
MAEKFLKREFCLGGYTVDMKDELNWYATPTGDLEWNGGLVRQGHFVVMANEYVRSGNDDYAVEIVEQMLDYIDKVPVYNPINKPYLEYKQSTWRPFEAAARMGETWPEALGKIIASTKIKSHDFCRILLSIHEHGEFVRVHHWKTGNHAVGEVASLGIVSVFFSEFKKSDEWRSYAVNFLMNMWQHQFHEDYYTNEMSGGYHWVAMRSFFAFYEVSQKNNFEEMFPKEYVERLIQASYAELYQEKPDYSIPITNDSSSQSNRKKQLERIYNLFHLEEIKYRLSEGKEGIKPEYTSYFFHAARVGIMRSDWSYKGNYLFFDMGRWGDNHMNEDQLNIEVSAYGRNILINSGRWRYTTSPDVSWLAEARYFKTTAAYNSVLVDGYSQLPADAQGHMEIHDSYDYAEGIFEGGYGLTDCDKDFVNFEKGGDVESIQEIKGVTHKRQVVFVKPMFWIVKDTIITEVEREAEVIFHLRQGELLYKDKAYMTNFDDANLFIKTLAEGELETKIYSGSKEPFRGWHCPYYDQIEAAPELSIKQKGQKEIIFNTLLFPIEGPVKEMPQYVVEGNTHRVRYNQMQYEIELTESGVLKLLG